MISTEYGLTWMCNALYLIKRSLQNSAKINLFFYQFIYCMGGVITAGNGANRIICDVQRRSEAEGSASDERQRGSVVVRRRVPLSQQGRDDGRPQGIENAA